MKPYQHYFVQLPGNQLKFYFKKIIFKIQLIIDSIINRTPTYLLEEIILIDDYSNENYSSMLENLPKVKFYRNDKREGLIRSRNNAAKLSVGEFLFFLDSHCEVRSSKFNFFVVFGIFN